MRETVSEPSSLAAQLPHLTKFYRRRHLGKLTQTKGVEDISLGIRKGEVFGLLGLNGAGKTTAIKLLLGLLFPTRGETRLFGLPLPNREIMHLIVYLPYLPTFIKYLTNTYVLQLYAALSDMSSSLFHSVVSVV